MFFRTCEDSTKEPPVRFISAEQRPEDVLPINTIELSLSDSVLKTFESAICDHKGIFVYFDKIVPQEDEADTNAKIAKSKKVSAKATVKGATANAEDFKPTFAKGWLNLIPLL